MRSLLCAAPLMSAPAVVMYAQIWKRWKSSHGTLDVKRADLVEIERQEIARQRSEDRRARMERRDALRQKRAVDPMMQLLQDNAASGDELRRALNSIRHAGSCNTTHLSFAANRFGFFGMKVELMELLQQTDERSVTYSALRGLKSRGHISLLKHVVTSLRLTEDPKALYLVLSAYSQRGLPGDAIKFARTVGLALIPERAAFDVLGACLNANKLCMAIDFAHEYGLNRLCDKGKQLYLTILTKHGDLEEVERLLQDNYLPRDAPSRAAIVAGLKADQVDRILANVDRSQTGDAKIIFQAAVRAYVSDGKLSEAEKLMRDEELDNTGTARRLAEAYQKEGCFEAAVRVAMLAHNPKSILEDLARRTEDLRERELVTEAIRSCGKDVGLGTYLALAEKYSQNGNADAVWRLIRDVEAEGAPAGKRMRRVYVRALCNCNRFSDAFRYCSGDLALTIETHIMKGDLMSASQMLEDGGHMDTHSSQANQIIVASSAQGLLRIATKWWSKLRDDNWAPSARATASLMSALVRTGQFGRASEVYDDIRGTKSASHLITVQKAAEAKIHIGQAAEVPLLRTEALRTNDVTPRKKRAAQFQNYLLTAYVDANMVKEAVESFKDALQSLPPELIDHAFFDQMLRLFAENNMCRELEYTWHIMRARKVKPSASTANALLGYATRANSVEMALRFTDDLRHDDVRLSEGFYVTLCFFLTRHSSDQLWNVWTDLDRETFHFRNPVRVFHAVAPYLHQTGQQTRLKALVNSLRTRHPGEPWDRLLQSLSK